MSTNLKALPTEQDGPDKLRQFCIISAVAFRPVDTKDSTNLAEGVKNHDRSYANKSMVVALE